MISFLKTQSTSIYASLIYSLGFSSGLCLLFCILRPRNSNVYAPRAKHADKKHAPPPVGKGLLSWIKPIKDAREARLVQEIGVDATVFLRFLSMSRNIFLCLTAIGCGMLIPLTAKGGAAIDDQYHTSWLLRMTPEFSFGNVFWGYVIFAYIMTIIVCVFLYINYRAVTRLRRAYFESSDYQNSLHSRTLMLRYLPQSSRTDEGLVQITEKVKHTDDPPRTAVARNTKDLPEIIEEYEETVHELEEYLAKYLVVPDRLPAKRPTCKPNKNDPAFKGQRKVDAIDYLTGRVKELGLEIDEIRESVDKRNPLPYGFASYTHIEDAHAVAWAARKKVPDGVSLVLAPKPTDLIWKNLSLSRGDGRWKSLWINFWIAVLTLLFIVPNVLSAIFLANLTHLGAVWPWFQNQMYAHPTIWSIIQGILAPLIQQLFYLFLPTIFRRLLLRSGDVTKTSRERHVLAKLYAFFVFNNLVVFSLFACAWAFIAAVVKADKENLWTTIRSANLRHQITYSLSTTSSYWVTWHLQRNLGAAIDLLQAVSLLFNFFAKHFGSPTPRRLIELSAPQPFLYANYYNSYLFVITSGMAFGVVQPIILPIVAFYIGLDAWLKKYLLQYVFITKTETGGSFWRSVFNRFLVATLIADVVTALIIASQGSLIMLYCMAPLPFLILAFKWYCVHTFDRRFKYFSVYSIDQLDAKEAALATGDAKEQKKIRKTIDRVGVKFGHPALFMPLIKPMVNAKAQHLLKDVLRGQIDMEDNPNDLESTSRGRRGNYSDMYMSQMSSVGERGKPVAPINDTNTAPAFEIVNEADCDFENFKRRAEFAAQFGGEGELYGHPDDLISRSGTPSSASIMTRSTVAGTERGRGLRAHSPASTRDESQSESRSNSRMRFPSGLDGTAETTYTPGYNGLRGIDESPERAGLQKWESADIADDGRGALLNHAANMGRGGPQQNGGDGSTGHLLAPKLQGMPSREFFDIGPSANGSGYTSAMGTPRGGGLTPMLSDEDETSYDYFRRAAGYGAGRGAGQ